MYLTKEQLEEKIDQSFVYHEHGVFHDGKIFHPEFIPLTIKNVKAFIHSFREDDKKEIVRKVEEILVEQFTLENGHRFNISELRNHLKDKGIYVILKDKEQIEAEREDLQGELSNNI